jgi:hypothetical protein
MTDILPTQSIEFSLFLHKKKCTKTMTRFDKTIIVYNLVQKKQFCPIYMHNYSSFFIHMIISLQKHQSFVHQQKICQVSASRLSVILYVKKKYIHETNTFHSCLNKKLKKKVKKILFFIF